MKFLIKEIKNDKLIISWEVESDDLWDLISYLQEETKIDVNYYTNCFSLSKVDVELLLTQLEKLNYNFDQDFILVLKELVYFKNNLKNEIEHIKNSSYEELLENDKEFLNFKNNVEENLSISTYGDFGDVTQKQLIKTYAMSKLSSYMNFSEPGAGKTLMTLMSLVNNVKGNETVIIVSPINSMNVWNDEIKKFLKWTDKKVHFYNNDMHSKFSDKKEVDITDIDYAKFILINYESAIKLSNHETNMKVLNKYKDGYHIVFDEAHRVKNGDSIRNKISKKLSKNAKSIITLTGTPFSNEVAEVAEMIKLTWPNKSPFITDHKLEEYASEINLHLMGKVETIKNIDVSTRESIKNFSEEIRPLYFSLKKKYDFEIDDANDKVSEPILVEALPVQREVDIFLEEKISIYSARLNNHKPKSKERRELEEKLNLHYTAAQQNSINPSLLRSFGNYDDLIRILDKYEEVKFESLPKIKASLEFVLDKIRGGEKVIVWFNFIKNINGFSSLLRKYGINVKEIYGDTPKEDRKEIIDSFSQKESNIQVLVSNPATLAESISLHKSVHISLFVERTFSYFRWAQAKDRIHRVGSSKYVEHNYVKTKSLSMEKKLFDNLNRKKVVADEILRHPNDFEGFISQSKLIQLEKMDFINEKEYSEIYDWQE